MVKRKRMLSVFVLSFLAYFSALSLEAEGRTLQVQLRNNTSGQGFQNPLVAVGTNSAQVVLFSLGARAFVGVEKLAEGSICSDVARLLRLRGAIVVTNDKTIFGQEYIADVAIPVGDVYVTMVGKLNPTNDGFLAVQAFKIPGNAVAGKWYAVSVSAYDAGSEYNDENCVHLISPPACGFSGQGYSSVLELQQENKIQHHPGLHGFGDLDPAVNNFSSPVVGTLYYLITN